VSGYVGAVNLEQLVTYIDLLVKWNRKINLTSLDIDPLTDAAIDRLIVEPVIASTFVESPGVSVIDLGSGGGSPAIPFKVQLPQSGMRMVESRSRKCAFLREAIRQIGLSQTYVEEDRFELLKQHEHLKSSAEIITFRAVRLDDELLDLIRWLLVPGGRIFRFTNTSDTALPSGLRCLSQHPLVSSIKSELQILYF